MTTPTPASLTTALDRVFPGAFSPTVEEAAARLAIFAFRAVWSNRQRRHATLGGATPTEDKALAEEGATA